MREIYTIGHSAHAPEYFCDLVRAHDIEVIADTRSKPYSKFAPQFDRESLAEDLKTSGARYLYLGDVLGGRPEDATNYDGAGRVLYGRVATEAAFLKGIARVEGGADRLRVALLCSEEDPAHCHRRLLIGRVLVERGARLLHVRGDGVVDDEAAVVAKSGKLLTETQGTLFQEMEEERWRSTASVSRREAPKSSSKR